MREAHTPSISSQTFDHDGYDRYPPDDSLPVTPLPVTPTSPEQQVTTLVTTLWMHPTNTPPTQPTNPLTILLTCFPDSYTGCPNNTTYLHAESTPLSMLNLWQNEEETRCFIPYMITLLFILLKCQ